MVADPAEDLRLEEERRLVERAQAGDRDALRPIFERYADPLYSGVVLPRLGNVAAAEDVLRETFLTAIERIGGFEWQGRSLYGWLRQIAANKIVDYHRRNVRTSRVLSAFAEETPAETPPELAADEQLIVAEETARNARRIEQAMAGLNPRYRLAIQLRLIEELPREECARRLEVTVGNFDVLLFRAVRAFRKGFGERDEEGRGNPGEVAAGRSDEESARRR